MFDSAFSIGYTLDDVAAAITNLLGQGPLIGLFVAALALMLVPKIMAVVRSAVNERYDRSLDYHFLSANGELPDYQGVSIDAEYGLLDPPDDDGMPSERWWPPDLDMDGHEIS